MANRAAAYREQIDAFNAANTSFHMVYDDMTKARTHMSSRPFVLYAKVGKVGYHEFRARYSTIQAAEKALGKRAAELAEAMA